MRFKGILVGVVCQFELGVADLDSSLQLGDQVVNRCIVVEVGTDRGMGLDANPTEVSSHHIGVQIDSG